MSLSPRTYAISALLVFSFCAACFPAGITTETLSASREVIKPITSVSPSNKDEITVVRLKGYIYNDMMSALNETNIRLAYHDEDKTSYLYCKDYLTTMCFGINREQRINLISAIKKYQLWNAAALEKREKLDKDIATLEVSSVYFSLGDGWYDAQKVTLTLAFLSQTMKKHQFLIMCPKLYSEKNSFISHVPDIIYLDLNNASALKVALGDAAINKAVTDRLNQLKVKAELN